MPLRICFVASEVAPLAKTGGLADVAGALPRYSKRSGNDVRVFMPFHSLMKRAVTDATPVDTAQDVELALGVHRYRFSLLESRLPGSDVPLYLIDCPAAFDRPSIYTTNADEHLRFLVLQRATLESCQRLAFSPHILHCNDWHTGLMPLMLKTLYAWDRLFEQTRSVLTIHNVGYQGVFDAGTAYDIGGDVRAWLAPEATTRNELNWLREGVRLAHTITTVSPTYAKEICTPQGGYGLDGILRSRGDALVGILNGVDYSTWNPATDPYLPHNYSIDDLSGKAATKHALIERLNLQVKAGTPLLGIVSRMTVQKGFDLLFDTLPEILTGRDLAFVVLGSGDRHYEDFFAGLQRRFPDRVAYRQGYHEDLAHLIEAASDMFLMPSMYEPCGLNQLYSLKYGSVPIVRRTGGLADSVQMWNPDTREGTGIVFNDFDGPAVRWAVHHALDLFKDRRAWLQMVRNGMAQDFSWEHQEREYERLYARMMELPR
jgi:starch synthase